MALAMVPAAAGTTAALLLAGPALAAGDALSRKYVLPKTREAHKALHQILTGANIGLGIGMTVAALSASVAVAPAAMVGVLWGGGLAALWQGVKALSLRIASAAVKKWPGPVGDGLVRTFVVREGVEHNIRKTWMKVPSFIRKPLTWAARFFLRVPTAIGSTLGIAPTTAALTATSGATAGLQQVGLTAVTGAATMGAMPPATGAAVTGTMAVTDYLARTGQSIHVGSFALFTPLQVKLVLAGAALSAFGYKFVQWLLGNRKPEVVPGKVVAPAAVEAAVATISKATATTVKADAALKLDEAEVKKSTAATVKADAALKLDEADVKKATASLKRAARKEREESISAIKAATDEMIEEVINVAEKAKLDSAAMERVNAAAAAATAAPVIVPITEAEVKKAAPRMTAEEAKQVVEDVAAMAAGKPLPQKQRPAGSRKPGARRAPTAAAKQRAAAAGAKA